MQIEDYKQLEQLTDHQLFDFVTEKESSQRRWVAMHLLELRRNRALAIAARSSAIAAWVAAAVAGVSAVVSVLAYFHLAPK